MPTWAEIKKINFKRMRKDPAWRAERMGFVKPAPKHLATPAKEIRQQRDSTRRQRAKAQSLQDRET